MRIIIQWFVYNHNLQSKSSETFQQKKEGGQYKKFNLTNLISFVTNNEQLNLTCDMFQLIDPI